MKRLFIAEKPSAARAIAEGLGRATRKNGYYECGDDRVSYCIGHLFSQKEPDAYLPKDIPKTKKGKKIWRASDLPIIPKKWLYDVKKETKSQLKILGELIGDAEQIIHAGDIDREGQAIVDQVLEHFKTKLPVKRFCVSAQDSISIKRGLQSLKDNAEFQGWRNAALGRQRADWLVGMNVTRALTLAAQAQGDNSLLVVGRVQSPTLALVVERDRLIEGFVPKDYYQVSATIDHKNGCFLARWAPDADSAFLDSEKRIVDKAAAEKTLSDIRNAKGVVVSSKKEAKSIPQPLGLTLSDITLVASNRYGLSADATLKIVQALYDKHKLCSYPRSDCRYLPNAQKADAAAVLEAVSTTYPSVSAIIKDADLNIHSRIWNDKKITAHHAIVPTMQKGNVSLLSNMEKNLYDVIVRNYIAQFYPKHEYDATTILSNTDPLTSNNVIYTFRSTGSVVKVVGWKSVYTENEKKPVRDSDGQPQQLPIVKQPDPISFKKPMMESKQTTPPKHFTEGTLIKALEQIHKYIDNSEYKKLLKEEDGIGTPATRGSIITDLKRRHYLDSKDKYLISSPLGRRLVDTLPESVTSPVLTAQYERELLSIQNQGGSLEQFVDSQIHYVKSQVANASALIASNPAPKSALSPPNPSNPSRQKQANQADSNTPACPECGSSLIRRKNAKSGKGFWWGCSGYPTCKKTLQDNRGKPDFKSKPRKTAPATTTEHPCPKCDSALVRRKSEKGIVWYGCSAFPACKQRFYDKGGVPDIS